MKICELCGSEFPVWTIIDGKTRNLNKRKYCLDCSPFGIHNTKQLRSALPKTENKTVEVNCAFCGQKIRKLAKQVRAARKRGQTEFFCNSSCAHSKEKVEIICAECGERKLVVPSRVDKYNSGRNFCSRKCSNAANNRMYKSRENHPNWKDGSGSYRSFGLGDRCEDCGERRYWLLIVHHRDGDHSKNGKDDLVTLCCICHTLRHLVVIDGKLRVRWKSLTTPEAKALLEQETNTLIGV